MNNKKVEFYRNEFPNTIEGFVGLARPFQPEEIQLADKEGLIHLCVALKDKELRQQIQLNHLLNVCDAAQGFLHGLGTKEELEETIKQYVTYT